MQDSISACLYSHAQKFSSISFELPGTQKKMGPTLESVLFGKEKEECSGNVSFDGNSRNQFSFRNSSEIMKDDGENPRRVRNVTLNGSQSKESVHPGGLFNYSEEIASEKEGKNPKNENQQEDFDGSQLSTPSTSTTISTRMKN